MGKSDSTTTAEGQSACLLCGEPLPVLYDLGGGAIVYCRRCRLAQQQPLPSPQELAALYASSEYFRGGDGVGYADYVADSTQFERTFRRKLDALLAHDQIDSLLEIGCGTGLFLQRAQSAGISSVVGVDPNPWAIEQAQDLGIDARVGSVDRLTPEELFDAVVMLDVIEHILDPVSFLSEVRAHLRPGGRLFLMTPNIRSVLAGISGAKWVSFKLPEHVFYYSPRSIRAILARAGFQTLSVRPAGQYVTLEFLVDRLRRIAPLPASMLARLARAVGRENQVVFVSNGSIDVVARALPHDG